MAYQEVQTPRFYINIIEWVKSNGIDVLWKEALGDYATLSNPEIFNTIPSQQDILPETNIYLKFNWNENINKVYGDNQFIAVLGHKFNVLDTFMVHSSIANPSNMMINKSINSELAVGSFRASYQGFSLITFEEGNGPEYINELWVKGFSTKPVGSIIIGSYYDMPQSPDLKLTMTREMDGVDHIRTKGGSNLVNYRYTKPAKWGDHSAWELYYTDVGQDGVVPELSRTGRRIWDMSFSYLDDGDIFGSNQKLGNWPNNPQFNPSNREAYSPSLQEYGQDDSSEYDSGDLISYTSEKYPAYNVLTDNSFYSQVIHKTNGGQLPFIFQPSSEMNPQNLAICKFDTSSFKFDQVANGVYNVQLKIREVW